MLLHLTLTLASDDPYPDEGWRALASQPNPVTSTTTYCLVNGGKVAFDEMSRWIDGYVKTMN